MEYPLQAGSIFLPAMLDYRSVIRCFKRGGSLQSTPANVDGSIPPAYQSPRTMFAGQVVAQSLSIHGMVRPGPETHRRGWHLVKGITTKVEPIGMDDNLDI